MLLLRLLVTVFVTVRDDVRTGRIYNRRVLQGLGGGAVAYLLLGAAEIGKLGPLVCPGPLPEGAWHWSAVVLVNLGVGLFVGVVLWLLGVWAAGDAKLFALYAFLVPPSCYSRTFVHAFPALPVLVNVFVFVFIFLLVDLARTAVPSAFRTLVDPAMRQEAFRQAPAAILRFIPLLLVFVAMFAGIRTIREVSREGLTPLIGVSDFTMFMILFVVFRPLARLVTNRWGAIVFSVLSIAALAYLVHAHGLAHIPVLLKPSLMAVVLLVFARAYPSFGQTTIRMKVSDLSSGMILAAESLQALKRRESIEEREAVEKGAPLPDPGDEIPGSTAKPSRFGSMTVEGLTEEQVRYVKTRWHDDEPISVARTIPFSPFLAAGAIATFLVGGPLTFLVRIS